MDGGPSSVPAAGGSSGQQQLNAAGGSWREEAAGGSWRQEAAAGGGSWAASAAANTFNSVAAQRIKRMTLAQPSQQWEASEASMEVSMVASAAQRSEHAFGRLAKQLFGRIQRLHSEAKSESVPSVQSMRTRNKRQSGPSHESLHESIHESIHEVSQSSFVGSTWRQNSTFTGITEQVIGTTVMQLLDFGDDDQTVLRGSSLEEIMRCNAAILVNAKGSAATYELSRPLREGENLDAFISHNWCVPRRDKWAVLALHFNFDFAMWATGLVSFAVWFTGTITGSHLLSFVVLVVPSFFLALYCRQDLGYYFGFTGPKVFLDKTCIHQTDPDIMQAGIEKLGAFLLNSKTMVVIYTDVYLRRLWTVYEIASFLAMSPNYEDMVIIPTFVPYVLASCLLSTWLASFVIIIFEEVLNFENHAAIVFVLHHGLLYGFTKYARKLADIHHTLEDFDVETCECTNESDRPLVYENIAALMRAMQTVAPHACIEEALHEFNQVAKAVLPSALRNALGEHLGIRYKHAVCVSICLALPYLKDEWSCPRPMPHAYCAFLSLAVGPALIAMTARLCSATVDCPVWKGLMLKEFCMLAMWAVGYVTLQAIEVPLFADCPFSNLAVETIIWIAVVVAFWVLGTGLVFHGHLLRPKSSEMHGELVEMEHFPWS